MEFFQCNKILQNQHWCSDSSKEPCITMATRGSVGSTISGADSVAWLPVKLEIASLHKGDNIQSHKPTPLNEQYKQKYFTLFYFSEYGNCCQNPIKSLCNRNIPLYEVKFMKKKHICAQTAPKSRMLPW